MLKWLTNLFRTNHAIALSEANAALLKRVKTVNAAYAAEEASTLAIKDHEAKLAEETLDDDDDDDDEMEAIASRFYCHQVRNGKNPF